MAAMVVRVAAVTGQVDGLQPMDIFDLRQAVSPELSPDGRRLVFIQIRRDVATDTRVSTPMLSVNGAPPTPLPGLEKGCRAPRWGADSRRVAFICSRQGHTAIEVLDTDRLQMSGAQTILAEAESPVLDMAWSRSGGEIAFVRFVPDDERPEIGSDITPPPGSKWSTPMRSPVTRLSVQADGQGDLGRGTYQTFVVPASGGAPRQVSSGQWWTGGFGGGPGLSWSADGTELLLAATRRPDWDINLRIRTVHAIRISHGTVREVTSAPVAQGDVAVSPDGRWVAYTAESEFEGLSVRNRRVYLVPFGGGSARCLTGGLDRSVDQLVWRGDGKAVLVSYEDLGARVVASISLDGRMTVLARDLGGAAIEYPSSPSRFGVARDGTIAYVRSKSALPAEVVVRQVSGRERVVTRLNETLAAKVGGFVAAEPLEVTASTDGVPIQGWLIRGRGASSQTPKPLILDIHGGPDSQYGDRFSIRYQLFAASGFNVVYANARGSTGYGEKFANLIHNDWPGHDADDQLDVVKSAMQRDFVDHRNVFVTGTSAGGTMSLWLTARTDLFRASVSIKPLTDWASWVLTSDIGPQLYGRWMGGALPWNDPALYWRRSPLSVVKNIHTPTLLISGDEDLRVPTSEVQQMYVALKLVGVDAAWVRAPGVSHNSYDYAPSQFLQDFEYTRWWFQSHRSRSSDQSGTGGGEN